ncbi:hypothetical protein CAEBREN_07378 [Caenorhabditis brenneri]|uniref:Uncharacterized protein n=1 Tax=Caenorhabditis brenneri TaxID=135651 RepID=G0MF77_CAEBE|nr:hypothetical protein CAEBREN_07378 [Caenorhabditis brenneri]
MEDNSVLNEDSSIDEAAAPPRKSMSQPSLAVIGEPSTPPSNSTPPKQSLSRSTSNVRSIPIIQTWHQNEELKGQIYSLRCEVQMHERKYLEAKEACHKSVSDVLDEYVMLKLEQEKYESMTSQVGSLERELEETRAKLENSEYNFAKQAEEFEREKLLMEQRIRELEATTPVNDPNNTTYGSLRGTLDDIIKKNDPDFTLTSGYEEKKIRELEEKLLREQDKVAELENHIKDLQDEIEDQSARLVQSENLRIQLETASGQGVLPVPNSTFIIGNARESQTEQHLKYIDELETKLTDAQNESEKARLALVEYMNRCSKLENENHKLKKNSEFDSSSILIGGKTSEELKAQIDKVNGQLNTLRAENRELRIRCDQLTGGDGNLSTSLGQTRLMAGISSTDLASASGAQENETGNTSIRMIPRESEFDVLDESKLPLMDTSAAVRNKTEFNTAYDEFESLKSQLQSNAHDTLESSFNGSMLPPDKDATQSFLSQKGGYKNSPLVVQKPKQLQQLLDIHQEESADQIQNNSFSTKNASPRSYNNPILQDMQHILDSSAILLEGQHDAAANVEKMQEKMTKIREALSRLFERLKSSAALFEDILEKMGSSSPLAERIKQMKLAFETSINDHADVSVILEAAEKDLNNMSLNFSILEKSILTQSFVADVSRRFTIAPDSEDVASSSLLNASYSPVFKFPGKSVAEIEKLQQEVSELKSELEKARTRDLRSPLQNTSQGRLSDVQIKANQNFEELEVCQATLKRVETEKAALAQEHERLQATHHQILNQLEEIRAELDNALSRVEQEADARCYAEEALHEAKKTVNSLQQKFESHAHDVNSDLETRVAEACIKIEEEHRIVIESLKQELATSLAEETAIREQMDEFRGEIERLRRRTREAEDKIEQGANEKQTLVEQIIALEDQLDKASLFELQATDCASKMAAKKKELETAQRHEEIEKEAVEGLERIQKEVIELTKKTLKAQIIKGNASSIRVVCNEMCHRITREREQQHEASETMKVVNANIEEMVKENAELKKELNQLATTTNNENAPPAEQKQPESSQNLTPGSSSKQKSSTFVSPTRALLHESTMAVDGIVQRLKKTHSMSGMSAELKNAIASIIMESRAVRDFLHQKLILFKGIDMTKWKNESVDQLVEKLGQYHQDNLMLEEQIKKYKLELKQTKAVIPSLGLDVEERMKREIGGIAKDMGAVKALLNKKK